MSSTPGFSDERNRLYFRILREYRAQYINKKKYYLAGDCFQSKGKFFDFLTTVVASVLLVVILSIVQNQNSGSLGLLPLALSTAVAALSYTNALGAWQSTSTEYYNSGQVHGSLFDEFEEIVKERFPDPDEDDKVLKKECEQLLKRKEELNQATSQLSSKWYHRLMEKEDGVKWDKKSLDELQQGDSDFYEDDEMSRYLKFKRFVVWPLI